MKEEMKKIGKKSKEGNREEIRWMNKNWIEKNKKNEKEIWISEWRKRLSEGKMFIEKLQKCEWRRE